MANENDRPIINAGVDNLIATVTDIKDDLSTLRPLLRNMLFSAYATDKIENAPIASFPDGADGIPMKSATFAIQPVQDLHGYDSPWPAGGGKNKLPTTFDGIKTLNTSGTWNGKVYSINGLTFEVILDNGNNVTGILVKGTASANTFFPIGIIPNADIPTNGIATGCPAGGVQYSTYQISIDDPIAGTVPAVDTGTGASFAKSDFGANNLRALIRIGSGYACPTSGLLFQPMIRLATEADATFAPYSNECPITGFTGAEVTRTGINWAKLSEDNKGSNQKSTVVYTEDGATVTATGTYGRTGWLIPVKPGQTYTVSFDLIASNSGTGYSDRVYLGRVNGVWDQYSSNYITFKNVTTTKQSWDYTFIASTSVLFIGVYVTTSETSGSITISNLQVELGSTATAYAPYIGTTHDITWSDEAGTVYGGTLEPMLGKLTVTHRYISDISTYEFTSTEDGIFKFTPPSDVRKGIPTTDVINGDCSLYKPISRSSLSNMDMAFCISDSGSTLFIIDSRFTSAQISDFKTAISGCEMRLPYITPIVYTDLTPQQITTLLGSNNIFADCGDVENLEYRADTALYIDKKLAE